MTTFALKIIYLCLALVLTPLVSAQSLVEDANVSVGAMNDANTFNETIKIISGSKKIFVLTNNNQLLGPGDFLSLALGDKLAARAVVAKTHQGQVGVKILKIYSLTQWEKLRRDMEVLIVKGDDSMFGKKVEAATDDSVTSKIKSEEDLFTGDVVVGDDLELIDENSNRHIKPDNLVSVAGAFYDADEIRSKPDAGSVRAFEFMAGWAYQFSDNIFVEGVYGRAMLNDYPNVGKSTLVNHLIGRLKYNIKGPLYTFFMPYVGFQTFSISSPDAGSLDNVVVDQQEKDAIENMKKNRPVFGITVLRRLVPGWFIKTDIGSDIFNVGFAIEF